MTNYYTELPENYELVKTIDAKNNKASTEIEKNNQVSSI